MEASLGHPVSEEASSIDSDIGSQTFYIFFSFFKSGLNVVYLSKIKAICYQVN